jgi:hypothetical protein
MVTGALIAAGIPALLAPAAGAHSPQPHPHAGRPPERVAYVHRTLVDDSSVPQRTGAL